MAAHQAPPSLGFSKQEHCSELPFPSPVYEKWKESRSVVSDSSRPHGPQLTRLLCPWEFPLKSTGVGCHRLLWRGCRERQILLTVGRNVKLWKIVWRFHKKLKIELSYYPEILLLGTYVKEMKSLSQVKSYLHLYVHCNITYNYLQQSIHGNELSVHRWMDKENPHMMEYCSVIKTCCPLQHGETSRVLC